MARHQESTMRRRPGPSALDHFVSAVARGYNQAYQASKAKNGAPHPKAKTKSKRVPVGKR
jgi:hypothetical protein